MSFIVIENFGGSATVCTDENGETLYFETEQEAEVEADDCQNGYILEVC